ncbi:MAG: hypothetical protein QW255_00645 [Candidatus Bilamarchaeaceae archaeon]
MFEDLKRIFYYSIDFYLSKILLIALFSLPFFFAFVIPIFVPAPTYAAAGGIFIRTGSLPEFSIGDIVLILVAYILSLFIISDTIININILIRSKRTLNETTQEMVSAIPTHVTKIFIFFTLLLIVQFFLQILLYDAPFQKFIYPFLLFLIYFLLFFIPPAIVIDNSDLSTAFIRSADLAIRKPVLIFTWLLTGVFLLILSKLFADLILAGVFAQYLVLLLNSIVFLPFLIILQTEMYMEKYPLAR